MKTNRRADRALAGLVAAMVAAGTVGLAVAPGTSALAQNQAAKKAAAKKAAAKKGAAGKGAIAADPLVPPAPAANAPAAKAEAGTYHYRLKIHTFDDTPLAASYYPAKLETNSPVVLLVHERDRSGKDFEDAIGELKGEGLAQHLQSLGYAVLSFDLRGYGANTRRPMGDREWREMVDDLQAVYQFLIDRHNRGELNVARLGVVALGEGANLAALWAFLPGGAVSTEGRVTDLSGLALLSPSATSGGQNFGTLMNSLAPRVPLLLMAGERDAASNETLKRTRANVEKFRLNRVELYPSALHGYKLLRLEPRITASLTRFLDATIKNKTSDWEPRYNLTPVECRDIEVVKNAKETDKDKEKAEAKEKAQDKAVPKEKEKEKGEEKAKAADDAPVPK